MVVEQSFEQLVQQGEVDHNWEATQKQVFCFVCSHSTGSAMLLHPLQNILAAGDVSLKPCWLSLASWKLLISNRMQPSGVSGHVTQQCANCCLGSKSQTLYQLCFIPVQAHPSNTSACLMIRYAPTLVYWILCPAGDAKLSTP